MDLWNGPIDEFVDIATGGGFGALLEQQFVRYHRADPSEAEVNSWNRSLTALACSVKPVGQKSIGILVEYHLPLSERRIDAMFFGRDNRGDHSVLVELKQWDAVSLVDDFSENVLVGVQEHVHPSQQALDYAGFLNDIHSDYSTGDVTVKPCSYCHNATVAAEETLREGRFARLLDRSPLFASAQLGQFAGFIDQEVGGGNGMSILRRVRAGRFQPSPKVIDSLKAVLDRDRDWHLLDEQRKAFNKIVAEVAKMQRANSRSAVLVRGGPGTGKTVIAVQAMAELLKRGVRAAHSTGGKAFTTTLQAQFREAKGLFTWNMSMRNAPALELDLLLVDEAHRIRKTSDTRFTKAADRNRRSQVDELLDAAKVTVFFLDENQYVRPDEIGESKLIQSATAKRGIPLAEYDLATQFRCGGSVEYLEWVDSLLGFSSRVAPDFSSYYQLAFAASPEELDQFVEEGAGANQKCRLVAGFAWPWSDPIDDLTLVEDVVIGDWKRPWNRKEAKGKSYRPENHPYTLWATAPEGLGQVGCVYSAQGFEFDRVGVIWGCDLVWRSGAWVAPKKASKDKGLRGASDDDRARLLRNAYRVLLTRGMKQTMVLCLDEETREHLAKAMKRALELSSIK